MMEYFYVEPEVAGGLGENTLLDSSTHPPVVRHLHYQFDGWLGDSLLESFPCFIVTQDAQLTMSRLGFSGLEFGPVEVTRSEQFNELHPDLPLPMFVWFKPIGRLGIDDFSTAIDGRLIVSDRALEALKSTGLSNAFITPMSAP